VERSHGWLGNWRRLVTRYDWYTQILPGLSDHCLLYDPSFKAFGLEELVDPIIWLSRNFDTVGKSLVVYISAQHPL
jgi:hypothetical protein